jgi:predicted ABC-type ATPase
MKRSPTFTVVAGPNGAGKSTYGHLFVPLSVAIFNGDLVFADLVRRYPAVDPQKLIGGVPASLETARDRALLGRKDFAFETNFTSDLTMAQADHFAGRGYSVNLIYFGLDDVDMAITRVNIRRDNGGHDIPTETINENYWEGVKRVKENLSFFDRVDFVDGAHMTIIGGHLKSGTYQFHDDVDWFNEYFRIKHKKQ